MFITKGHFLSPFIYIAKNGKQLAMLHSVDTDLMVAIRIVGYEQSEDDDRPGAPLIDLVKVDEIKFIVDQMPSHLQDLLPESCELVTKEELGQAN